MKFLSKLVICTVLLAFSTGNIYAKEKKQEKRSDAGAGSWKAFSCETGIAEEAATAKFPCKPFQGYSSGTFVFVANEAFVNYKMVVMNITSFIDNNDELSVNRSDYADDTEFRMALLKALLQEGLDDQDEEYSHYVSHHIFLNNGHPTLDAVEVHPKENTVEKTRVVITKYAAYYLITECKAGMEDQHDVFVNSLQID